MWHGAFVTAPKYEAVHKGMHVRTNAEESHTLNKNRMLAALLVVAAASLADPYWCLRLTMARMLGPRTKLRDNV